MAFPTSSLTNNQVHKEGNRAFVYDSALGVWDQVRETDRTENKIVQGEIGSNVTGSYSDPRTGNSCRMYLTSAISNSGPGVLYMTQYAMTTDFNQDTTLFTPRTPASNSGIEILVSGTYLFHWAISSSAHSSASGIIQEFLTVVTTNIGASYHLMDMPDMSHTYYKLNHICVITIGANSTVSMMQQRNSGTRTIDAGIQDTAITATFLHA